MGDQREEKRQASVFFSDAVRQNVEHTEPYILPANCPALYSALREDQEDDAVIKQGKRLS